MKRADRRAWDEMRPVKIIPRFQNFAEGSALIELGQTRVLCSVSVEERVPGFLRGGGSGWITAEYAMLPRATVTRTPRDRASGRSQEIQRLIGRSLRAITDLDALGERTLIVDCDVLQADGGTRTAAITGSYVALYQALQTMANMGILSAIPLKAAVAATSVGIVHSYMLLDLCYDEDFTRDRNIKVITTRSGPGRTGERIAQELGHYGVPVTFIDDTAIGLYISTVNKAVVGADRICADGKLINGIGTYQLALAAKMRGIPFYVLCETLKFDPRLKGDEVDLEEKDTSEVVEPGRLPLEVSVKNPYFDVIPLELVTGIVTENGLLTPEEVINYMGK